MRLQLAVQRESRASGLPGAAALTRWAQAALAGAGPGLAEVTVRLVDEAEARRLNHHYRGKRKPTNVLSFGYEPPTGRRGLLGDLVICAPVVQREAAAQGKRARAHWAHLVVHGIMHLRGYDHVHEADARVMEACEVRVLRRLGFSNPYD